MDPWMSHLCLWALKKSGPKLYKWKVRDTKLEAGVKGHNFTSSTITGHQPLRATIFLIRQQTNQCSLCCPTEPSLGTNKCLQERLIIAETPRRWIWDGHSGTGFKWSFQHHFSIPTALSGTHWQCWLFWHHANPCGLAPVGGLQLNSAMILCHPFPLIKMHQNA